MGVYGSGIYGTFKYGYESALDTLPIVQYYVGDFVPEHAINLGYINVPALTSRDSVRVINQIGANITSIPKNKRIVTLNVSGRIANMITPTDYCVITSKFALDNDEMDTDRKRLYNALWYRYKLRSKVRATIGASEGYFDDAGIYVYVDKLGKLESTNKLWRVVIDDATYSADGIYECSIWTNFQASGYRVSYTPEDGTLGHSETLNPMPAFFQSSSVGDYKYTAVPNSTYSQYTVNTSKISTPFTKAAIWFPTDHQWEMKMPSYTGKKSNWYIKIGRGQFTGTVSGSDRIYRNDSYYNQNFVTDSMPLIQIVNDKCTIVNNKQIKITHGPLYVDGGTYDITVTVDGNTYTTNPVDTEDFSEIVDYDSKTGIITLPKIVQDNSSVSATYYIWELYYKYRGYINTLSSYMHIDFNTNYGHYTSYDSATGTLSDSNLLIHYAPSFWINPHDSSGSPPSTDIYHNFNPNNGISVGTPYISDETIQLGMVSIISNVKEPDIMDGRNYGGGLKDDIIDDNESEQYWDIGFWEGRPYQSNGVAICDINNSEYEKEFIKDIINEYRAVGTLVLLTGRTGK